MGEGDEQEKNKGFIEMKLKLKKSLADIEHQEGILNKMKEKLSDALGADGFFIK